MSRRAASGLGIRLRTRNRYFLLARQMFFTPALAGRAGGNQSLDLGFGVVQGLENGAR